MIHVNIINGAIALGSDGNYLLTMRRMTKSRRNELMSTGLENFRKVTADEVRQHFETVKPSFESEKDREVAISLVEAAYREVHGTSGIHKDDDVHPVEMR